MIRAALAGLLLLGLGCGGGPEAPGSTAAGWLDLRVEALPDLWHQVRHQAQTDQGPAPPDSARGAALAAARAIEAHHGPRGWALLATRLAGSADGAALVAAMEAMPSTDEGLHADGLAYARALAALEADFVAQEWPGRRAAIRARADELQVRLRPEDPRLLDALRSPFGLGAPAAPLPFYLVLDGPEPPAITLRTRAGPVSFAAVATLPGTLLDETVLHECVHALAAGQVSAPPAVDLFTRLRAAQEHSAANDPAAMRELPHLLIFAHAAEMVRRHVDPAHRDYGELRGAYARSAAAPEVLRVWTANLDGLLDEEEVVSGLLAAALPPADGPGYDSR
ncbi:MAG TPA: hypothetical protein VGC54_01845 [Planctomycetota bacterium]